MPGTTSIREFQGADQTLRLSILSDEELMKDYLPLRFLTLHHEMHWTKKTPSTPLDLRDEYDVHAWPFGVYLSDQLIAAIRLIPADSPNALPSAAFIPAAQAFKGRVAEISRAMVAPDARRCALFTILLLRCRIEANVRRISHLFISVRDSGWVRFVLLRQGFRVLGSVFDYEDRTIASKAPSIVLHAPVHTEAKVTRTLTRRLDVLLADAYRKLERRATSKKQERLQ